MKLNEDNYREHIDSLTQKDWQPLLELIPEIENASEYGRLSGGDEDEKGMIQMPYNVPAPVVSQFLKVVYDIPIIVSFNWGEWKEGRRIANDGDVDLDTIDLPT